MLAVVSLATNVVAAFWTPTLTLRQLPQANDLWPEDLSAKGVNILAGWKQEPADSAFGELWVRESTDSGGAFAVAERLAVDPTKSARDLSIDSGGGSHWAVWSEKRPTAAFPARARIFLGAKLYGGGFWDYVPVSINADIARHPTIAHTAGRLFVSYQARVGGAFRVIVQNARTDEGVFSGPTNLGSAPWANGAPHLDATNTRLYVAWSDGRIRLKRATLGGAPAHDVSWLATQDLGEGSSPVVVAGADRVAVFYHRDGGTWVRVSQNGGATFSAAKQLLDGDPKVFVYVPENAAMSGPRIVLSAFGGGDAFGNQKRVSSNDGGLTWTVQTSNANFLDDRQEAFTSEAGTPKLAEIWFADLFEDMNRIVFHREE